MAYAGKPASINADGQGLRRLLESRYEGIRREPHPAEVSADQLEYSQTSNSRRECRDTNAKSDLRLWFCDPRHRNDNTRDPRKQSKQAEGICETPQEA